MKFRTRSIHVGSEPDPTTGAVVPPIHTATTFIQPGAGEWGKFDYSRSGSPTRNQVEKTIASLEGGFGALLFSSGMAATHCAMMLLEAGDHVVAGSDIYGGSYRLLHKILNRSGIEVTLAPAHDTAAFEAAFKSNTKMAWIETIGNPLMTIPDIRAIADLTHKRKAMLGIDNTFANPDTWLPSASQYRHRTLKDEPRLGGHSDCLSGALVAADEQLFKDLYFTQNATGAVLGPFDSFLLGRGLKTLDLRIREQSRSAMQIAKWLESHPKIKRVLYPGLESHLAHKLASRQMNGVFGAMLTFEIDGDLAETKRICESTKLFGLAVSLGAVESLIEQPATMSHASYATADKLRFGITDGLIRLSIGLEDPEDLIADLEQAIDG